MGLDKLLVISAALFCCGLYTILTRRNAVAVLMGVELILNSANINFVAFSHYVSRLIGGQIFAVFVIVLAGEAAVALAISSWRCTPRRAASRWTWPTISRGKP
jgi:NADH-quinone oxidoreductase subunit K